MRTLLRVVMSKSGQNLLRWNQARLDRQSIDVIFACWFDVSPERGHGCDIFFAAILDWIRVRIMSDFIHPFSGGEQWAPMRGCSDECSKGEGVCGWIGWAPTKGGRHTANHLEIEGWSQWTTKLPFYGVIYIIYFQHIGCLMSCTMLSWKTRRPTCCICVLS